MADSRAAAAVLGTPRERRSGGGSVAMRASMGTMDSSVSREKGRWPVMRVWRVDASE